MGSTQFNSTQLYLYNASCNVLSKGASWNAVLKLGLLSVPEWRPQYWMFCLPSPWRWKGYQFKKVWQDEWSRPVATLIKGLCCTLWHIYTPTNGYKYKTYHTFDTELTNQTSHRLTATQAEVWRLRSPCPVWKLEKWRIMKCCTVGATTMQQRCNI